MNRRFPTAIVLVATLLLAFSQPLLACPFCSAVSQTFTEEIGSMDAVVVAELVKLPPSVSAGDRETVPKAEFRVSEVIKGESFVKVSQSIETIYFGEAKKGQQFLIMSVDPPQLAWSTPLQLSARAKDYVPQLLGLPAEGPERLYFFQQYLEDDDEMLARDAYDEFAKVPYEAVKALEPRMDHDQLVSWIKNPDVPASRRRLYLTMLGVCGGGDEDIKMLEGMLGSDDRKLKAGLDAMIGCYLTLTGELGMPMIEDLFLKNNKAEYADTYAAIMALRFHGSETDVIPRERLLAALRLMLERPQLADLVIPDLARWDDWSVMERLVRLFKDADEKSSWVRVPVINYLRACPKPESDRYIEVLREIDPDAVKRANTFFPFGGAAAATPATN